MYKKVYRMQSSLLSTFLVGVIFFSLISINLADKTTNNNIVIAIILCPIIFIFWGGYYAALREYKKAGWAREWLSSIDLILIATFIVISSYYAEKYDWAIYTGIILSLIYAIIKLRKNVSPFWGTYYLLTARAYFREVAKYKP